MKKIVVFLLIIMMLCLAACGFGRRTPKPTERVEATEIRVDSTQAPTEKPTEQPTEAPTDPPTEAPEPPTEKTEDAAWKQLYIDFLDSLDQSKYCGYSLVYINEDDIPELVASGSAHVVPGILCWVYNGKLCQGNVPFMGFEYFERQNKYFCEEGYTGQGFDYVRRINGSVAEDVVTGEFCINAGNEYYRWNGVDYADADEYSAARAKDFDRDAADTVAGTVSYEEICKQIQEF